MKTTFDLNKSLFIYVFPYFIYQSDYVSIYLFTYLYLFLDPYWTIIPAMIGSFYHYHPLAQGETNRATITFVLTLLWSARYVRIMYELRSYEL